MNLFMQKISLFELLQYLRNFFPGQQWHFSGAEIRDGRLPLDGLTIEDYYLVEDNPRNNGIHQYGNMDLKPGIFSGTVTEVCAPQEVLTLLEDINSWITDNEKVLQSPYQSESFGGYSYTKSAQQTTWKTVFAERLRPWRKL